MALADELFREFRSMSVSEFFRKNAAMLGYTGRIRSLTTIVHEGVTNAIDAGEECGKLPNVYIRIENLGDGGRYRITIEDNASGIPEKYIPEVFGKMLAGSKAHRNMQSRGQQGLGISGAVLFCQTSSGKPVRVISSTGEKGIIAEVMIDVEKNKGKVSKKEEFDPKGWMGTRVEMEAKGVSYNRSKYGAFNYLRLTSLANPHVQIELIEPDGTKVLFERVTEELPKPPKEVKPHPYGITADDLLRLAREKGGERKSLKTILVKELSRFSDKRVRELKEKMALILLSRKLETQIEDLDKYLSEIQDEEEKRRIKKIYSGFLSQAAKILRKEARYLNWEEADLIVNAFSRMKLLAPPTEGLSPIGEENISRTMKAVLNPEFVACVTRPPKTYRGGIPFQVEVGIAYGGQVDEEGIEVFRFANRTPLLFDRGGCAITEAVKSIDWKRYGIDPNKDKVALLVNIVSVHIPYTSTGKQAIADVPEISKEIRLAVMEVARKLMRYVRRKKREMEKEAKMKALLKYVPEVAKAMSRLTGASEEEIETELSELISKKYLSSEDFSEEEREEAIKKEEKVILISNGGGLDEGSRKETETTRE